MRSWWTGLNAAAKTHQPRTMGWVYVVIAAASSIAIAVGAESTHLIVLTGMWMLAGTVMLIAPQPKLTDTEIVVPFRGLRRRHIPFNQIAEVLRPGPFHVSRVPFVRLRDGELVPLLRLSPAQIDAVAVGAGVRISALPSPAPPPRSTPASPPRPPQPMNVGREADAIHARDLELRRQLDKVIAARPERTT